MLVWLILSPQLNIFVGGALLVQGCISDLKTKFETDHAKMYCYIPDCRKHFKQGLGRTSLQRQVDRKWKPV